MKKTLIKLMAIALSIATCFSVVGCGPVGGGGGNNDKNTIYVYNYNGGYGSEWLERAKIAYEELKPGTTIQINKQKPMGALSASDIKAGGDELWFSDSIAYYNFFAEGVLEGITPALTQPNPYDNNKTVESKLTEEQKEYYKINGADYYALPHYSGYMGFFYNVETFEKNGFYFKKERPSNDQFESNPSAFFTKDKAKFGLGPDGKPGTFDDGMPETYEDFHNLLTYMSIKGFDTTKDKTPIVHTGGNNYQYVGEAMYALMADYEGKEQTLLNFNFSGTAKTLGKIVNGQFVKDAEPTVIKNNNGYELARQEGKYLALDFLNKIYANDKNYDKARANSNSYTTKNAATALIRGNAGVLFEGVWWEEESKTIFTNLGKDKYDYKFSVMPFPKATADKVGEKVTIFDHLGSTCFVKKGISEEKKAMVYDFIQFLYSDARLIDFTATTGTLKAVNYEVPESALSGLTHYEKSLFNYYKDADVVYPYSTNPMFYNNSTAFRSIEYLASTIGDKKYRYPVAYFVNDRISGTVKNPTAETYFNGMYDYYSGMWSASYNKYFD